ncbi:hypothetical protein AAVH_35943 [Aphelenchoides avenae]|nr:hypothetical protein AAVH_35943 [Aphelenchus avenae]
MVRLKPPTDKELLEQALQLIEKDKRLAERIDTACDLRHKERLKAGREVNAIRFDLAWVGASLDLESQAIDELTGFLAELLTLPTRDADDIKTFTEGVHLSSAARFDKETSTSTSGESMSSARDGPDIVTSDSLGETLTERHCRYEKEYELKQALFNQLMESKALLHAKYLNARSQPCRINGLHRRY